MPSRELLKKAESGDVEAMYQYAQAYSELAKTRDNFDEDIKVVMHWIKKAAELGHAEAQSQLASGLRAYDENEEAFLWEEKAAKQGLASAQFNLAVCYQNGTGTPINYDKQFYWHKKAAENGLTEAKHSVAVCYIIGQGTNPDFEQAVYWLKQAANEGHANAKARLGAFYIQGMGVSANEAKGIALVREAAKLGDERAKEMLEEMGLPQSPPAKSGGCYIATCVYGSYDSTEVLVLRRFRDDVLYRSLFGRIFIRTYYAISPMMVRFFGKYSWFREMWKPVLDKVVNYLR
ncbi:MAG: sel1 repeat family protein [Phycisphaerales bacterium]|nr:sel1 repeat family protein [Phycisphaerales bacterium]